MSDPFPALEGLLLYRALTQVFDNGENRTWLFYVTGYGFPLLLATSTLIIAVLLDDPEYTM